VLLYKCSTSIVFADNQLYASSISISPLTTIHRDLLPQILVQSFTLIMVRSLAFGSNNKNYYYLHYVFILAFIINSLTHNAKGTSFYLTAFKVTNSGSFHSFLFFSTFPHGTFFSIAHSILFSLRGYTPFFIL